MLPFFITSVVMVFGALIWAFLINPERSVVETLGQNEQVQ